MDYKSILSVRAELELEDAVDWYESRKVNLGIRFLKVLKIHIKQIEKNPYQYPNKHFDFRESNIRKFPFVIIYKIAGNKVVIHSIFNTYRNPSKKPK